MIIWTKFIVGEIAGHLVLRDAARVGERTEKQTFFNLKIYLS
ncbi:MAG: hypothetical protein ACFE8V_01145 [Promethearchaeota archaeon]